MKPLARLIFIPVLFLAACSAIGTPTIPPSTAPVATSVPTAVPDTPAPEPPHSTLSPVIYYPHPEAEIYSGQEVRITLQVFDEDKALITDADAIARVIAPSGEVVGEVDVLPEAKGVYRSAPWNIPSGHEPGEWRIEASTRTEDALGTASIDFEVIPSTSDVLLRDYGFYIDPPTLGGIAPSIFTERGDSQNGLIRWGGLIAAVHIMPANWLEIHWREGQYILDEEEDVRRFLLEELGDLGFTPVRSLGPYSQYPFKDWDAWLVKAKGEFLENDMEYVVFYAPEVDKTYALGTTVVLPPVPSPHNELRKSFTVFPGKTGDGTAPEPLQDYLAGPIPTSPEIGERFKGLAQPIVLEWQPVKELAEDEYYEVEVDFHIQERQPKFRYATRETSFTLPEDLYWMPNCSVFNWQVRLMRQTGMSEDGKPIGEQISHYSLYQYLWWFAAPGDARENLYCPYAHRE